MFFLSRVFIYMSCIYCGSLVKGHPLEFEPTGYSFLHVKQNEDQTFSSLPNLKLILPKLLIPDFNLFGKASSKSTPRFEFIWRQNTVTSMPNEIKNYDDIKQTQVDCSNLLSLDCEEQKKLIQEIFTDTKNKYADSINDAEKTQKVYTGIRGDQTKDITQENTLTPLELESTTFNYDSTTPTDDDPLNRMAPPEVISALLG